MPDYCGAGTFLAPYPPPPVVNITPTNRLRGTWTDRSGTIAAGGVSQMVAPANAGRNAFIIQNPSTATESLFVNATASAGPANGSFEVVPGGYYADPPGFVSTEAITVYAHTAGHAFTAKEG